jgi:hypothetical protein
MKNQGRAVSEPPTKTNAISNRTNLVGLALPAAPEAWRRRVEPQRTSSDAAFSESSTREFLQEVTEVTERTGCAEPAWSWNGTDRVRLGA